MVRKRWDRWKTGAVMVAVFGLALVLVQGSALAQEVTVVAAEPTIAELQAAIADANFMTNNVWMMLSAGLVFIMHLGFATVETGLTRSKNTVNILFKNTLIPGIGLLTYAICGFNLMYPGFADGTGYEWFGFAGFGIGFDEAEAASKLTRAYMPGYTYWTDFLFQGMFAATAATIVSGAVAERIKLHSFLIFSTIFVAICYPIVGSWKWGYGWLHDLGFYDFAGSTLVHSVGGWGALMGAIILGPRLGKYSKDGTSNAIPGHSFPLATIGVFLLWLGWFGFNGGSVLSADPALVSLTLVTTCLAAAAGAVGAMLTTWITAHKPDLSMVLNGILAGLVGITAGADQMNAMSSSVIGLIAGVLVVFAVLFIDRILKIDDPVGAISVHLVCGIWGTLAVGLLGAKAGMEQLKWQITGIVSIGAFTAIFAGVLFLIIKATLGLRVSDAEQLEGLDLGEHDQAAYPDFQQTYIKSYHIREA
ncbi:MAG: ammonium transporter [Phycisphaeraceae bacterium]